jgi:putative PIN family toxin of toxin-antitoxin system
VRIVLDTNVVVSGTLTTFGPPGQILELVASGDIEIVVDDRILAEYVDVLARPRFKLDPLRVDDFLRMAAHADTVVGMPLPFRLPDIYDEPFLEVAIAGAVDALVTGNEKHFKVPGGKLDIPILTPCRFLDVLSGR